MARRKLIWARTPFAVTSLEGVAAGTGGAIEVQDLLAPYRTEAGITRGPVGLTVVRIRMTIGFDVTATDASGTVAQIRAIGGIYYGIRVYDFPELAAEEAAGIVARGPMIEPHLDWMTWGRVPVRHTSVPVAASTNIIGNADVDVRSMRKIDELGQTLGLAVQTTSGGAGVAAITCQTSVLLALP